MRIAFVTAEGDQIRNEDVDRSLHETAFEQRGIQLEYRSWSDRGTDWSAFDLVVLRSTWDYAERPGEFLEWLEGLRSLSTLNNPAGLVRWNLDKNYLRELHALGTPIVPTFVEDDLAGVAVAMVACRSAEVIIKPTVSAGSRLTGWFDADDPAAMELAREILAEGNQVIVEPFVSSVAEVGEVSVVTFDGQVSHALTKGPILERGGGLIGGSYREEVSAHDPSEAQLATARSALEAVCRISVERDWLAEGTAPLYGRFDMVELDDGSVALLEAELFEPCFFLGLSEGAADRFADACIRRAADPASL